MLPSQLSTFRRFPSGIQHIDIRDRDGSLLAYGFRVPDTLVPILVDSDKHLPQLNTHQQRKIDPQ